MIHCSPLANLCSNSNTNACCRCTSSMLVCRDALSRTKDQRGLQGDGQCSNLLLIPSIEFVARETEMLKVHIGQFYEFRLMEARIVLAIENCELYRKACELD